MKPFCRILATLFLASLMCGFGAAPHQSSSGSCALEDAFQSRWILPHWQAWVCGFAVAPQQSSSGSCALECVLKKMDAVAADFHTAQADFVWDQYQKEVDEHDTQKGTVTTGGRETK